MIKNAKVTRTFLVIVREALRRGKGRWTDGPYLTRNVFCQMIAEGGMQSVMGETGFGIGATMGDNEHRIIVLDTANQMVCFAEEGNERHGPYVHEVPFEDYVAMSDDQINTLYDEYFEPEEEDE